MYCSVPCLPCLRRCGTAKAAAEGADGPSQAPILITAVMLSGRSATAALPSSSSVVQLKEAFAKTFGFKEHQVFAVHFQGHILAPETTLEQVGLNSGSLVEVCLSDRKYLMGLPSRFMLRLSSMQPHMSSEFTLSYNFKIDIPQSHIEWEEWRSYSHDKFEMNTLAGTMKGVRQRYGDDCFSRHIDIKEPVASLLERWIEKAKPVASPADRFWLTWEEWEEEAARQAETPADLRALGLSKDLSKIRPIHRPKFPWPTEDRFIVPSVDCKELVVNADMGFMVLLRILVDEESHPIRVALRSSYDAEEYKVRLKDWP